MREPGRHRGAPRWTARVVAVAVVLAVAGAAGFAVATSGHPSAGPSARGSASSGSPAATVPSSPAPTGPPATPTPTPAVVPRPHIVWDPIPFPASRRAEMAAYAKLHYGRSTWRLVHPRVIVEHYTASMTFSSVYSAFAHDAPDPEFHSLPADCAHFVIDRDGTIYQLVPLAIMCRHTVGLNWTAVGIEMVGTSDQQILSNPPQLRSAIRLTAWLMQRLHIRLRNVIGHNESLDSPFHHELVASWRCQTHGDWQHADMVRLRADVARALRQYGIAPGPPWRAHPQAGC